MSKRLHFFALRLSLMYSKATKESLLKRRTYTLVLTNNIRFLLCISFVVGYIRDLLSEKLKRRVVEAHSESRLTQGRGSVPISAYTFDYFYLGITHIMVSFFRIFFKFSFRGNFRWHGIESTQLIRCHKIYDSGINSRAHHTIIFACTDSNLQPLVLWSER